MEAFIQATPHPTDSARNTSTRTATAEQSASPRRSVKFSRSSQAAAVPTHAAHRAPSALRALLGLSEQQLRTMRTNIALTQSRSIGACQACFARDMCLPEGSYSQYSYGTSVPILTLQELRFTFIPSKHSGSSVTHKAFMQLVSQFADAA